MRGIGRVLVCLLAAALLLGCAQATPTPEPMPTPTLIPSPTPIPGFARFQGTGVELWLPASYQGGDLSQDLDILVELLNNMGYSQYANTLEANPAAFLLWALDSEVGATGGLTNVSVAGERVLSAVTLDIYVEAVRKQLPTEFVVSTNEEVDLSPFEARRLEITAEAYGAGQAMYILKQGNRVWAVTYSTGQDEYAARLPSFEQSIRSFRVTE